MRDAAWAQTVKDQYRIVAESITKTQFAINKYQETFLRRFLEDP